MGKLTFTIICTILVSTFQNCAREIHAQASDSIINNGGDPEKVRVSPSVWPNPDSVVTNPNPLNTTEEVVPYAIDFGVNPNWSPSAAQMSWGWWIYNWKQATTTDVQYLGAPEYLYRLDLFKFAVIDIQTRRVIYTLTPAQVNQVNGLLGSSTLANAPVSSAANAADACTTSTPADYATLESDYGDFDLVAGAPCATVDLMNSNGLPAGLQNFLNSLPVSN